MRYEKSINEILYLKTSSSNLNSIVMNEYPPLVIPDYLLNKISFPSFFNHIKNIFKGGSFDLEKDIYFNEIRDFNQKTKERKTEILNFRKEYNIIKKDISKKYS